MGLFDFLEDLKNSAECFVADAQYKAARNKYEREYGDEEEEEDDEEYVLQCDTLPNGLPIGLNVIRKKMITTGEENNLKKDDKTEHIELYDVAIKCFEDFSENKLKKMISLICKEQLTPDLIVQKYGSVVSDKVDKVLAIAYEKGIDIEKIIIQESNKLDN